jgi:hypothetical protein
MACLAIIIQLNISVKEQINITRPFYDEISKYSQSLQQIFQALNSEKCIANFVKIGDANFVATNVKKYKTKTKNIYLEYFVVSSLDMFLKQLEIATI